MTDNYEFAKSELHRQQQHEQKDGKDYFLQRYTSLKNRVTK